MLEETRTAISIQTTGVRGAIQLWLSDVSGFFESSRVPIAWVRRVIDFNQCRFERKRIECMDDRRYTSIVSVRRTRLSVDFSELNHFYRPGTSVIW